MITHKFQLKKSVSSKHHRRKCIDEKRGWMWEDHGFPWICIIMEMPKMGREEEPTKSSVNCPALGEHSGQSLELVGWTSLQQKSEICRGLPHRTRVAPACRSVRLPDPETDSPPDCGTTPFAPARCHWSRLVRCGGQSPSSRHGPVILAPARYGHYQVLKWVANF